MALETKDGITKITCDKCAAFETAPSIISNDMFYEHGWALHRGRKYIHLCVRCLPTKSRRAMEFVRQKFYQKPE